MVPETSYQKKLESVLKEIRKGRSDGKPIKSLSELLEKNPELVEKGFYQLEEILQKAEPKAYKPALAAMKIITKKAPSLLSSSSKLVPAITKVIKNHGDILGIQGILEAMEILVSTAKSNMVQLKKAIPLMIDCLGHWNSKIRASSFYILDLISSNNPEYFKGKVDLLKARLNGLNDDERMYAARIIGNIAKTQPDIVEPAYEDLKYLALMHLSNNNVRLEAAYALAKFGKMNKEAIAKILGEVEEEAFDRLIKMDIKDMEIDAKVLLEAIGLKHLLGDSK